MITLETLEGWLSTSQENEHLDFKEAKQQYDFTKLLRYCVAFANELGGHLVLGVSDGLPRRVVGTNAFLNVGEVKSQILNKLHFRVEIYELSHSDGRVLVFEIPPRPIAQPQHLDGAYLMRSGEELVPMTPDQLRRIILEEKSNWFVQTAKTNSSADEVISLLGTQIYFDLLKLPYPTTRDGVLDRLTTLAAILLAKRLDAFSPALARKAPRVVIYKGADKLNTQHDKTGTQGYAVAFDSLLEFVHSAAHHKITL
jgi:ATP-dependent DNA helicase RecG